MYPEYTMSAKLNRGVEVNFVAGSDDTAIVRSRLSLDGLGLPLTWGSRFVLLDGDLVKGIPGDRKVSFSGIVGSITLSRLVELACWRPRVVYGYDPDRKEVDGSPAPGFVNTGLYRPLLAEHEEGVRVLRIRRPSKFYSKLEKRVWLQACREYLEQSGAVQFGSADEEGITVIDRVTQIKGTRISLEKASWGTILMRQGLEVLAMGSPDKRSRVLTNLYGYSVEYAAGELTIEWVDGSTVCEDGFIEISPNCVRDLALSRGTRVNPDHDWHRERCYRAKAFSNFRCVTPEGTLKGDAVVNPTLKGRVVRCHRSNLKAELRTTRGQCLVAGEPKSPKGFARMHVQYWLTHAWLFRSQPVQDWIFTEAMEVFESIKGGKLDHSLDSWVKHHTEGLSDEAEKSVYLGAQWAAFRWAGLGLKLSNSWGLTSFIAESHLKFLRNWRDGGNLSPRISCSLRCKLIPESPARRAGILSTQEPLLLDSQIKICGYDGTSGVLPCAVVSDDRWAEMVPVHGTADLDDDFDLVFRTINKERKVIILRTPSGPGEYTILDPVPGDWSPTTVVCHMTSDSSYTRKTEEFPVLLVKKGLPPRSGSQGPVASKLGTPSPRKCTSTYDVEWLLETSERLQESQGIGPVSNLLMLWADATGGEAPLDAPAELSDLIDAVQKGGGPEQFRVINDWLTQSWLSLSGAVADAWQAGKILVDPFLWNARSPARLWAGAKQGLVNLFTYPAEALEGSRFQRLLVEADSTLELFLDRKHGKVVEWLSKAFESHPVFEVLGELAGKDAVEAEASYLNDLRKEMSLIEQSYATTPKDTSREVEQKKEARKAAYVALDLKVERDLLPDEESGKPCRMGAFLSALYRHQGKSHRDGVVFASPRLRRRLFELLEQAMPLCLERQAQEAALLADMRSKSDSLRPW